jgi:gliding motility-associated-like protein
MKDDFLDNIIKEKLNQQQYEFTAADWSSFESKQGSQGGSGSSLKWYLGGAAAAVAIAAGSYFLTSNNSTETSNEEPITVAENHTTQDEHNSPETTIITDNHKTTTDNPVVIAENINEPVHNDNNENDNETTSENNNPENNNVLDHDIPHEEGTTNTEVTAENTHTTQSNVEEMEIAIPSAVIMAGDMKICPGEKVSLETIQQDNVSYAWNLGDDTYSDQRTVTHTYDKPGKYTVSLIVTSTKDHSILSKSKDIIVEVMPLPNTDFEVITLDEEIISSVQLLSKEELPSYYWEFGDGSFSTEASPTKSFKRKGYYNITLTSENHEGCTSKTTKKITIAEDYNLLAPNSFTPNGDGINDFFVPEALKTMNTSFTMTIYSQSEGLIFETKNINQQWDGSNQQNGTNCAEGTYIWVVSLINSEGKSEQYKGAVLLLK